MLCTTIYLLLLSVLGNALEDSPKKLLQNPTGKIYNFLSKDFKKSNNETSEWAVGEALFLTPLIKSGQIEKARLLATVPPLLEGIESFSGYLTVRKDIFSNLFFWLFKSRLENWEERPLVIWLQGGPGVSSMYGLFKELGPFQVDDNDDKLTLEKRQYSWHHDYNLVFIDNPVGAGFSFTKSDSGYARTQTDVARDLYNALNQLYQLFPALKKNKLIIAGESYAGKYIPAIAYKIYRTNKEKLPEFKIPLAGIIMGNAYTDPYNMLDMSSYLYQLGLIDERTKQSFFETEDDIRAYIRAGMYNSAYAVRRDYLSEITDVTGLKRYYDFMDDEPGLGGPYVKFLNDPKTRRAIHVGNYEFNEYSMDAKLNLRSDFAQSVKPWVEELLAAEEFPILFYTGQLDIIVAYPLSRNFYLSLQWPRAVDYHFGKRCQFVVDSEVAGYYKTAGTFTEILVRNAGHMVPASQPKWASALLETFISNSSAFECK